MAYFYFDKQSVMWVLVVLGRRNAILPSRRSKTLYLASLFVGIETPHLTVYNQ